MKIRNNISFGKTLVGTCQIHTPDKDDFCCKIFELTNTDDYDYFQKLGASSQWKGNKFVWVMKNLMESGSIGKDKDTFVIENQDGNCLGYINTITHKAPYNKTFIHYIETCPTQSSKKKDKRKDNIAQALVGFIVKKAQNENRDKVSTLAFDTDSRIFFGRTCRFKYGIESSYDFVLEKKQYSKFLETTGKTIELNI